jgi:hypothetical protein
VTLTLFPAVDERPQAAPLGALPVGVQDWLEAWVHAADAVDGTDVEAHLQALRTEVVRAAATPAGRPVWIHLCGDAAWAAQLDIPGAVAAMACMRGLDAEDACAMRPGLDPARKHAPQDTVATAALAGDHEDKPRATPDGAVEKGVEFGMRMRLGHAVKIEPGSDRDVAPPEPRQCLAIQPRGLSRDLGRLRPRRRDHWRSRWRYHGTWRCGGGDRRDRGHGGLASSRTHAWQRQNVGHRAHPETRFVFGEAPAAARVRRRRHPRRR